MSQESGTPDTPHRLNGVSPWRSTHPLPRFSPLIRDTTADVVIVGGGITGLTAAVLLSAAGKHVILIERDQIASGETGNTTSHLTEAIDARYQTLAKDFGEEGARLVARASRDAIAWIEQAASSGGAGCGFARVPGYLYSERQADVEWLANELDAARRAGSAVSWTDRAPLPFAHAGAVQWDNQAQVHATAYLDVLLKMATVKGVRIHEQTRVVGVEDGEPCRVLTEHGDVRAKDVLVAANVPINNRVWLHTKIAAYRSYAIAVEAPPALADGLFWDTDDPYHYTRTQEIAGTRMLIIGGEDHRTGENGDTSAPYERLIEYARQRFGATNATYRWSGQIIEPVDGLPYIGPNVASTHVYVATGYAGNGMTFGTLAGLVVSDRILGRANPYAELFDATRIKPLAAAVDYVTENALFPARLLKDRLTPFGVERRPIEALRHGEGGVFSTEDGKLAVCRDHDGHLHAVSAVCTHLACDVAWNRAEQTWDCPCHGSRFTVDGKVINGPAVADLAVKSLPAPLSRK